MVMKMISQMMARLECMSDDIRTSTGLRAMLPQDRRY